MTHQKITIEYPLATKSPNIIWELISTAAGLQKWMADYVEEQEDAVTFTWGEAWTQQDVKTSHILEVDKHKLIRFKWEDHEEEGDYWEMRIDKSELTGMLTLLITDHAEADDINYIKDLWEKNLDRLHRVSGL